MNVRVDPTALQQAAKGIDGVIEGLSGAPVIGSYSGQTGRGFNDLELSGRQMSKSTAKSAMDDFCERWEWGMRALVQTANDIAHKLKLGVGMYEKQEQYNANALKDFANDLVGDPSLQKESVRDADGNIITRGTDDMSAGELVDYNKDRLTHPDVSAESFAAVKDEVDANLESMKNDLPQAAANAGALGIANPTGPARQVVDSITGR